MLKQTSKITILLAVLFSCLFILNGGKAFAATSSAEQIINKLPDDVIAFAASSGGSELEPAFKKTILGKMCCDPNVQTFIKLIKNEIIKKIQTEVEDPNVRKIIDDVFSFINLSIDQPFMIGTGRNKTASDVPFYGFAIIDAKNKTSEIPKSLAKLESYAPKGLIIDVDIAGSKFHWFADANEVPGYWGWIGNYLVFALNDGSGLAVKFLKDTRTIPATAYLANLPTGNDALIFYTDFQKLAETIKSIAADEFDEDAMQTISSVMTELGLADIKYYKSRTGFDGSDIVENSLLEYNGLRKGLLASLKSIDASMLDLVDSNAVSVSAFNVDLGVIYDSIINAIRVASPNDAYPEALKAIAEAESEIGFSIRRDLLASFAGPMIFYTMPAQIPSASRTGVVLISKLSNPQSFEKLMIKFGNSAAKSSDNTILFTTQNLNGKTYYSIGMLPLSVMQIMPTWTVVDDKLIAALNPPLCEATVKQVTGSNRASNSIRTKESFKKAAEGLRLNPVFFDYTDSKVQMNEMMITFQQFWPSIVMMASQEGLKLPWMLPSLSHIIEQMQPSFSYSWFDSKGLHSLYRGSGAEVSLAGIAGIGALMPALALVRQTAQEVVAGTYLSSIGKTMLLYASKNDEKYPPDLKTLIEKADLPPKLLESPRKPKNFTGPSFIYITGQNPFSDPGNIVVYENPEFCTEKINVLYNDGHVEAVIPERFKKELEETYKRLGREMPVTK